MSFFDCIRHQPAIPQTSPASMKTTLTHVPRIQGTDAMRTMHLALPEMIESGAATGKYGMAGGVESAHVIRSEFGQILAMMVWHINEPICWIDFAWTRPGYRRHGFYRQLFQAVCSTAREKGCNEIEGSIAPGNTEMQECALSVGRHADRIIYSMRLDQDGTANKSESTVEGDTADTDGAADVGGAVPGGVCGGVPAAGRAGAAAPGDE